MGRRAQIGIVAAVVLLLVFAVGAGAYDSSQQDEIADGVTVAGVDVGGLDRDQAERRVRRRLLSPLQHSIRVGYDGRTWKPTMMASDADASNTSDSEI